MAMRAPVLSSSLLITAIALSVSCSDRPTRITKPPVPCTALLCETFERPLQPPWQFSNTTTVKQTQNNAFSGQYSLEVTALGNGHNANYLVYDLGAQPTFQRRHYGRMMIHLSALNPRSGDFTLLQADGITNPISNAPDGTNVMYRARIDGRHDHLMANYDTWVDNDGSGDNDWLTDCWKHPNGDGESRPPNDYILPAEEWACMQWHVDAGQNEIQLWLNGALLSDIHVQTLGDGCMGHAQNDRWLAPAHFRYLRFGLEQYHSSAKPRRLYIDDIAIHNKPVPCPQ